MISVEKLVFPGILAGCLFLVFFTRAIASPTIPPVGSIAQPPQANVLQAGSNVVSQMIPIVIAAAGQEPAAGATEQPAQEAAAAAAPDLAAQEPAVPEELAASQEADPACSLGPGFSDSIRQWCDLIESSAGEHGLDPNLIAAVMVQESGGDPRAYSKSGAVGLLQVMPRDGLAAGFMCINGPCFGSRPSTDELFDPEFNISYGARMLAGLIQRHGNPRDALKAYGPMNMGYHYADLVLGIFERSR